MASLRLPKNSPYYIACLTLPGGRTNRSTKTTDRRLAQRLADEWQAASDKAREGTLVESQARKVLNDLLDHVGQENLPADTVESFLNQWLAGKGDGGTADRYRGTVHKFLEHLGDRRTVPVAAVGHQDILSFIQERERVGVAPKTLSVDVRTLSAAFTVARKLGLVMVNPVERALVIRPITVESSQRDIFSPDQVKALLSVAKGEFKTLVLLGYYTGARLSDCVNMRRSNLDLVRGVIDFVAQKTGNRVVVPAHPTLLSHLQSLSGTDLPEAFLCPSLAARPSGGKRGLSSLFKRLMAEGGVDPQTGEGKGLRQFSKLSFHSLRHSFNSALANAGVAQETRMAMTGHSSATVNRDYTHLDLDRLRVAVEKLPALS